MYVGKYESFGNYTAVNKAPNLIENITRCSFSLGPIWHRSFYPNLSSGAAFSAPAVAARKQNIDKL